MRKISMLILMFSFTNIIFSQINFQDYFEEKTLRFDYIHTGTNTTEEIIFDELIEEPYWGGSKNNLVDTLNLGNFFFKIYDQLSGELIYSRGFGSLFQEWQSTEEAKHHKRVFNETVVFPFPKRDVKLEILKRSKIGSFDVIYETKINPKDYFISKEKKMKHEVVEVHKSGDSSEKLDIVFLPEGYSQDEINLFKEDCKIFSEYIFKYEPFSNYRNKINVWGVLAPSKESGTDIPGDSVWKSTVLNSSFYTFDSERYLMTQDVKSVRDAASNAPYDQIMILVNTPKYGGGAIYNYYSMTSSKHPAAEKVFIHEFAHGLAGLADEYGDDPTYHDYYSSSVEPWEKNITTLVNFEKKWKHLIKEGTPIPTPDSEEYKNNIGVFEGAGYVTKGVYRSTYDSLMRSLKVDSFNQVSIEALKEVLDFYTK